MKIYKTYTDITSIEDACEHLGISSIPKEPYYIIKTIARAINSLTKANNGDNKFPDWSNHNQYKWFPRHDYNAGSGWVFVGLHYWDTATDGSVAHLKTREASEYIGKLCIKEYILIAEDQDKILVETDSYTLI